MQTNSALIELVELLEEYAPAWYSEEHHHRAMQALGRSTEGGSLVSGSLIKGPLGSIESLPAARGSERNRFHGGACRASLISRKG
jgi:hypothetical protein